LHTSSSFPNSCSLVREREPSHETSGFPRLSGGKPGLIHLGDLSFSLVMKRLLFAFFFSLPAAPSFQKSLITFRFRPGILNLPVPLLLLLRFLPLENLRLRRNILQQAPHHCVSPLDHVLIFSFCAGPRVIAFSPSGLIDTFFHFPFLNNVS